MENNNANAFIWYMLGISSTTSAVVFAFVIRFIWE